MQTSFGCRRPTASSSGNQLVAQKLSVQHFQPLGNHFNNKATTQVTGWETICLQTIAVRLRLTASTQRQIGAGLQIIASVFACEWVNEAFSKKAF